MANNLRLRHAVMKAIRGFLEQRDFLEVETPCLTSSTPEGSRDFLVPSRYFLQQLALPHEQGLGFRVAGFLVMKTLTSKRGLGLGLTVQGVLAVFLMPQERVLR